jgi:predicted TIM-barrel enzyme
MAWLGGALDEGWDRRNGACAPPEREPPDHSLHAPDRTGIRRRGSRLPIVAQRAGWAKARGELIMLRFERKALIEKFRAMAARGEPIVGAGAGIGLSAKCEEAGGVDLIVIYNSGRYRMAGRGSLAGLLAYGDANAIVVEMAGEVLPVVKRTPVLAGVNGTDPFRDMDAFLDQIKALGFAGVQNFPTVGLIDGTLRANLEETGMAYALEVDMIAKAHAKDMLTTPYVFSDGEAEAMARAGADIIVCHLGLTAGGVIGAGTARRLEDCPALIDAWADAALRIRPDVLVLAHGGPVAEPADADFIMKTCKVCHGFYGASSMERLPVERALTEQVRSFKAIGRKHSAPAGLR